MYTQDVVKKKKKVICGEKFILKDAALVICYSPVSWGNAFCKRLHFIIKLIIMIYVW